MARPKSSAVRLNDTEIVRIGAPHGYLHDLYHFLLTRSWLGLLGIFFALYLLTNLLFALGYRAGGDCIEGTRPGSFTDLYFFSVQTLATIGYGQMAPRTLYAHILVAVEAFAGMIWLAMTTGMVFAKFSRPTARVLFSKVAVIVPRSGVPTLMVRMANERGNQIVEAQLHIVLLRREVTPDGEQMRRFYELELERARNVVFALSWTGLHPITPDSPLYGATSTSLAESEAQLIVSVVGLDSTSSQTMHARKSYRAQDLVWNARFVDILSRLPDGRPVVDYQRFHDVQPISGSGTAETAGEPRS